MQPVRIHEDDWLLGFMLVIFVLAVTGHFVGAGILFLAALWLFKK